MTKSSQSSSRTAVVIMAAGKGTRLKSKHPKVLHEVGGKPLLAHVIAAATQIVPASDVFAVIGHEAERVREAVASTGVDFVVQAQQLGTGHALMVARDAIASYDTVIVLSGDAPLIRPETIAELRDFHVAKKAAMTILSALLDDPGAYGRVVRKSPKSPDAKAIVEFKSANAKQRKIREINSGIYAFSVKPLLRYLDKLETNNAHGEYYLTDMAEILRKAKERVVVLPCQDFYEVLGGNTRAELVEIDRRMRRAKCHELMNAGVTIYYPETCVIDSDVTVAPDSVIEPFVQLLGSTHIGADVRIYSHSVIRNCVIGDDVVIKPGCIMTDSKVHPRAILGPYSHLRPDSEIGEGAHIGNFVETKKVNIGKGSKANHLTYLGNAEIGAGVNVGAGTITCNYDGVGKYPTTIEDGVFIGSDTTLVAPVKVGKGAYVAAASCITEDVPADALGLGRARQIVKEGWAKKKREERAAAKGKG